MRSWRAERTNCIATEANPARTNTLRWVRTIRAMAASGGWAEPRRPGVARRTKTAISATPARVRTAAAAKAASNPNTSAIHPPAAGPTKSPTRWIPARTAIARPPVSGGAVPGDVVNPSQHERPEAGAEEEGEETERPRAADEGESDARYGDDEAPAQHGGLVAESGDRDPRGEVGEHGAEPPHAEHGRRRGRPPAGLQGVERQHDEGRLVPYGDAHRGRVDGEREGPQGVPCTARTAGRRGAQRGGARAGRRTDGRTGEGGPERGAESRGTPARGWSCHPRPNFNRPRSSGRRPARRRWPPSPPPAPPARPRGRWAA